MDLKERPQLGKFSRWVVASFYVTIAILSILDFVRKFSWC